VTRFGGHVAKYLGDGVIAFFGYPEAQDNDAERAVRAGLTILDAVSKLVGLPARARPYHHRTRIDSYFAPITLPVPRGRSSCVNVHAVEASSFVERFGILLCL